jgi:hypothetical protein
MRTTPKRLRARRRPGLTIAQILAWADAHHTRTGQWPNVNSGRVKDNLNENWRALDLDLHLGLRGLPAGTS